MKRFKIKILIFLFLITFGGFFFVFLPGTLASDRSFDPDKIPAKISRLLAQLRAEIKEKNYRFTVGYNPAMEFSIEELCGFKSPPEWKDIVGESKANRNVLRDLGDLPDSLDWRALGGVTPVKNQGQCGSCWAFGTVAPMESAIKIYLGQTVNLSEQYLVSCNEDGWGCDGGWWGHDYHLSRVPSGESEPGAVYESDFPYTATDAPCNPPHPHAFLLNSWGFVPGSYANPPSVADIKDAIYTYGPVGATVAVGSAFHAYTGGVFEKDEAYGNPNNINHAIALVGWNDDYYGDGSNFGVWILKNSWGTSWGESGFMYITYDTSLVGYAANYVELDATSLPTVDLETPQSPQSEDIELHYTLFDNDSDPCDITVEYTSDGGQTYFNTTSGPGGEGVEGLSSSPGGEPHVYVWDSFSDLSYGYYENVRVRITPNDGETGTSDTTQPFDVDNSDTDGDGLSDLWELAYFGNLDQGAEGDYDDDGLTNLGEYENYTDPTDWDTDDDTYSDGDEVNYYETDPNNTNDYPQPPLQPSITSPSDQSTDIPTNPGITSTAFTDPNQGAAEGLLAQWQFEGNGLDETDNNNDGTVHGAVYTAGKVEQALDFDGISDSVEIPNSDSLNITEDITIETWIYPHSIDSAGLWDRIVEKGAGNQYSLSITQRKGIVFRLSIETIQTHYSPWIPPTNEWTHIVATYDQSYVKIYANGNEIYSSPQTGAIASTGYNLYIGNWGGTGERPFDGIIDEVAIYNRALSGTEIDEHYQKGLNSEHNPASSGDTHASSDWEVYEDEAHTQLVWSSENDTTNLTSTTVNAANGTFSNTLSGWDRLQMATTYWVRVRHSDNRGGESEWSEVSGFRTSD